MSSASPTRSETILRTSWKGVALAARDIHNTLKIAMQQATYYAHNVLHKNKFP